MRPDEGVDSNNCEIQFYCHRKCQATTNLGPTTHITYVLDEWLQQIRYILIFSCPSGISQSTEPTYILTKIKKKLMKMKHIAQTGPTFFPNELLDVLVCVWLWTTRDKICVCIWRMGLIVTCKKIAFYRSRHNIGFKLLLHFRRIIGLEARWYTCPHS